MVMDYHLDGRLAVANFRNNFESLSRLPLITDAEASNLFGDEVNTALARLDRFNQQEHLCQNCSSHCCGIVDCELYDSSLSRCPIQPFRPLLCRMHFCQKYIPAFSTLVKDLGDIFLDSLLVGELIDKEKIRLMDSPPLAKLAPEMVNGILAVIKKIKAGRLEEKKAWIIIQSNLEPYQPGRLISKVR